MTGAGLIALASILSVLFIEECGAPLPMFPADGLLIAGGVLIATGAVRIWIALPVLVVGDMIGATTGYYWVRLLGRHALDAVVRRLGMTRLIDALAVRLQAAGVPGVFLARLIPGTRAYTNLVSGAIGVRPRTFLAGMLPASALWVTVVTFLGMALGVGAERYISRYESLGLEILIGLGVVAVGYVALRFVPGRSRSEPERPPGIGRILLGLAIDVAIVLAVAGAITASALGVLRVGEPDGFTDVAVLVGVLGVVYVLITRLGTGATTGERLLRITYRQTRRPPDESR
ncbi:MAG TPA: DedA family protein [Candidatus Dormibacteraeota bacterium]|jgi:membrane protein DedA with SNARE-associated domain|nr:DedA family protein [Candidatus Dormibacteraeota bacterium]